MRGALEDLGRESLKRNAGRKFVLWMGQRNDSVRRNSVAGIPDVLAVQFGINCHVVANLREWAVFVGNLLPLRAVPSVDEHRWIGAACVLVVNCKSWFNENMRFIHNEKQ